MSVIYGIVAAVGWSFCGIAFAFVYYRLVVRRGRRPRGVEVRVPERVEGPSDAK